MDCESLPGWIFSKRSFYNWKIAIIVEVIHEVLEGGSITILRINAGKGKRRTNVAFDSYR
jgi:hypothetical protein